MGLVEQLRDGAVLERENISFVADAGGTGTVPLGSVYAILSIQTTAPCRLRLYDTLASRDDATEAGRTFGDTNIPDSIALVGDFSMSAVGLYTVDPLLYGAAENLTTRLSYYRINPPGATPNITIKRFLLDDRDILPNIEKAYDIDNRRTLPVISAEIADTEFDSGSLSNYQIPVTYLLVSASLTASNQVARLRLYNNSSSINNVTEQSRPFSTEPSRSIGLITDMILDSTSTLGPAYFSPKIIGSNLQNMGTNLQITKVSNELIAGKNELYYILENINVGSPAEWVGVELNVYSLED